jgi:hypothetical protein
MQTEYNFWAIFFATVAAYCLSTMFVRKGILARLTHRRIWNWMLLLGFLSCGPLGFLLAFFIDGGVRTAYYGFILWLHVEAGIVMAIVSVLHIFWHWQYFWRNGKT